MENRKSQIIQVAISLIKEYGYDSFSYKDLSETVGITKATLHHHFPKKEDLGMAVLQRIMEQLEYLEEKTFEIQDARERVKFMFNNMLGIIQQADICPISSLQAEFNVISESLQKRLAEISEKEISILARILEEGKIDGTFTFEENAKKRATIMMCSYKGALMYARALDVTIIDNVVESMLQN